MRGLTPSHGGGSSQHDSYGSPQSMLDLTTCRSHGGVSFVGALSGTIRQRRGTTSQHVSNMATILVVTRGIGILAGVVVRLTADDALSARSAVCF